MTGVVWGQAFSIVAVPGQWANILSLFTSTVDGVRDPDWAAQLMVWVQSVQQWTLKAAQCTRRFSAGVEGPIAAFVIWDKWVLLLRRVQLSNVQDPLCCRGGLHTTLLGSGIWQEDGGRAGGQWHNAAEGCVKKVMRGHEQPVNAMLTHRGTL